jgi:hypothetical protein
MQLGNLKENPQSPYEQNIPKIFKKCASSQKNN